MPVLFGRGVRLPEPPNSQHAALEPIEVIETPGVTHLRYRVVK